ncbi:SDR family oxidoreductase [Allosalinactinospora lopnorensis]|uniref:SDR family oxidoreductase n=1 Tax=Allosalinactinospora lopnorensis TaxID=1352348 RepID=UPI00191BCD4B|nr:SDR family oxidoreductase [Allosalinactinospora lopnorensis]
MPANDSSRTTLIGEKRDLHEGQNALHHRREPWHRPFHSAQAAAEGANVVIAAKTAEPHPKLPGTIHTVAAEIEEAGGRALPLTLDVRQGDQVAKAVASAARHFGGIDVLVNNASAVFLAKTADTPLKRFDLMFDINVRGTFTASQACIPYLERSENGHILTLSPPIDLQADWFANRTAYTMSKYAMSMTVLGLAEELRAGIVLSTRCGRRQ